MYQQICITKAHNIEKRTGFRDRQKESQYLHSVPYAKAMFLSLPYHIYWLSYRFLMNTTLTICTDRVINS